MNSDTIDSNINAQKHKDIFLKNHDYFFGVLIWKVRHLNNSKEDVN